MTSPRPADMRAGHDDDEGRFAAYPIQPRPTVTFRMLRVICGFALRCCFGITVRHLERVPGRNCVLVSNHLGWADAVVILLACPPDPRVHVLGEVMGLSRRTQRFIQRAGGIIPIDRSHHDDLVLHRRIERFIDAGASLLLFPEAEFGFAEGQPRPFKKGFAHFAISTGVPVLPCALSGTETLSLRRHIRLQFGDPIDPAGHTVESLVTATEQAVRQVMPPVSQQRGPRLLERKLTTLFL